MALLSPRQRTTIEALVEVLLPAGGRVPGGLEAGVPDVIQDLLSAMQGALAGRIRALIEAWDAAPLLAPWAHKRFHALTPTERTRFVRQASRSPLTRIPYGYLKQIVLMAYGASPIVEEAIGFSGKCLAHGHEHP